jgi:hypothetical protein
VRQLHNSEHSSVVASELRPLTLKLFIKIALYLTLTHKLAVTTF